MIPGATSAFTSLLERPPGSHDMAPEQLEAYNTKRKQRVKKLIAVASKCCEDKQRAQEYGTANRSLLRSTKTKTR